jgi:N-acetylglucosamine-6-phosphate deacetylase
VELLKGNVVTPFEVIPGGAVVISDGLIVDVLRGNGVPRGTSVTDAGDGYVMPGLVDIHNHGGLGFEYMDATEEAFRVISRYLAAHGVTTALAATDSAPLDAIVACLEVFRQYRSAPAPGCRLVGVHLEGPYLSVANRGAQPEAWLRTPRDGYEFVLQHADVIRVATVSPELDGMTDMIRAMRKAGIVVSGGHDDAIDAEIMLAIDAGMTHTTHVYCAMSSLPKRAAVRHAGLCEVAMTDDRLTTEMIADNRHIPPILAKMIYRCKGPDRLCIVSDCIRAGGMPPDAGRPITLGKPGRGGQPVIVVGDIAMLPDKSRYAGSIQALDRMICNVVRQAGVPIHDAVRMASLTPASVIGLQKEIGSIEPGKRADLCITDGGLSVLRTICGGETVYSRSRPST